MYDRLTCFSTKGTVVNMCYAFDLPKSKLFGATIVIRIGKIAR